MAATQRAVRLSIPQSQQNLIFSMSAGYCAFPDCNLRTVALATDADPAAVVGEIAHIHSYDDNGPRANRSLTAQQRNQYANLILLCPNHHTLVDKQFNTYTAVQIQGWKANIERWVLSSLKAIMPQISFSELEIITRGLLAAIGSRSVDYTVIPPQEKMDKNGLSHSTRDFMMIALARANVVTDFVDQFSRVDPSFADRLRAGFVAQYETVKAEGTLGDELFENMLTFACSMKVDMKSRAAGLAVLGYFFEACEVFEK
jgi:hypothetical protein